MKKFVFLFVILPALFSVPVVAQESQSDGFNPNSVHPIHEDDMMYKKRVWRRMDLKEKQNKSFFASGNEITKIIIDAAKAGILPIYATDSLTSRLTKEEFLTNLENPQLRGMDEQLGGGGDDWGGGADDGWGDTGGDDTSGGDSWGDESTASADIGPIDTKFAPRDVSVLEIIEDMIFDKKRSVLVWDIQAIKLVIPAEKFTAGILREVGVFKYKDLVKLFRSMPDEAIWFNAQNSAAHKNLADAFALRLFNARIIKVANPNDDAVIDVYSESPRQGILASQWMEYELMEKEHELWSY
ncbi:hypothetical protein GCM10011506_41050 [Marivirga lumbricoides]|uniref:Gliding motility protein GldN n=1 Tax=Marivirga lumbricoides TaxID=1046115 RepID=A0A2T4DSC6_9BACT|nr:gliding motility protein GldN [Marivirga lumbricoides]GGC51107.1 hypothetical protein GCM10011506_41050 [Marivirga lumbricoides]